MFKQEQQHPTAQQNIYLSLISDIFSLVSGCEYDQHSLLGQYILYPAFQ